MDYEELISNLDVDAVVSLMEKLGADRHVDKGTHIIFPTICHNEDARRFDEVVFLQGHKVVCVLYELRQYVDF